MFRREMATLVRLVKSAADQGGLLTGAELSLLMNRSLPKIHNYIRAYEAETGEALPLKGSVLDMGSSPTHKGIICGKFEEGMSPPDIARARSHNLGSVDKYLGTYGRIKVLLRKGFDAQASMDPMMAALKKDGATGPTQGEMVAPGGSGEADSRGHPTSKGRSRSKRAPKRRGSR